MEITLKKYGANSQALVIPKSILELLKINSKTKFSLMASDNKLIIETKSSQEDLVNQAIFNADKKYGKVFESLSQR